MPQRRKGSTMGTDLAAGLTVTRDPMVRPAAEVELRRRAARKVLAHLACAAYGVDPAHPDRSELTTVLDARDDWLLAQQMLGVDEPAAEPESEYGPGLCRKCGHELPVSATGPSRRTATGLCIVCTREARQ